MTTTLHTLTEVRAIAHSLNPNAKNPYHEDFGQCLYADPDNPSVPSCIAGTIIYELDREVFSEIAEVEESLEADELSEYLHERLLTPEAFNWLRFAQNEADRIDNKDSDVWDPDARATWGQAVATADVMIGVED